jgi:endoglucanase
MRPLLQPEHKAFGGHAAIVTWPPGILTGGTWTGPDAEKYAITKQLENAATWAKAHDRPIFLGEFGAFQEADMKSRARWTQFVAREAERLGFSWSYWEFCSGFGAYDQKTGAWREALKSALVP